MAALFGTRVGKATLLSPVYNYDVPVCLKFYYWISTRKIILDLYTSTQKNNTFSLVSRWMYQNQTNFTSWNEAALLLDDGVGQLKFVARKVGLTTGSEFVNIDRIALTEGKYCASSQKDNGESKLY
jgi:hypothetical protein